MSTFEEFSFVLKSSEFRPDFSDLDCNSLMIEDMGVHKVSDRDLNLIHEAYKITINTASIRYELDEM